MVMANQQADLFSNHEKFHIAGGWHLDLNNRSTAASQRLVLEVLGEVSTVWHINAVDQAVFFLDGRESCRPPRKVIESASKALYELTEKGQLFPMPLSEVIHGEAWAKGYDCGFNNGAKEENVFSPGEPEYSAWLEGWRDSQLD